MPDYRLLPAGDTALVVEFGDCVDRRLSERVLALAQRLNEAKLDGVIECVPTFRSLMIHFDPLVLPSAALTARIARLVDGLRIAQSRGRTWRLPVCYDASLAPDLDAVASQAGMKPAQIIERHSTLPYHVYMLGFLPGQAYMGDLPAELALPRRASPRTKIPAGSLAIATTMTSIFPMETPCGWHLIGRSPVPLWDPVAAKALLRPGDQVTFAPISLCEYDDLSARVAAGRFRIAPCTDAIEAAA